MRSRVVLHEEHLYRMLEQTLVPPVSVVELDPDTLHRATSRLGDVEGSVSERYNLDSMLTPAEMRRLPSDEETTRIRQYYFATTAEGYDNLLEQGSRWAMQWPSEGLRQVLEPCWTDPATVSALFSVDVLVVLQDALWRQVPGRDGLIFEGRLTARTRAELTAAVPWPVERTPLEQAVFTVGAFGRVGFVYGKRALRATYLATGIALGALTRSALRSGAQVAVVEHFVDHYVNVALDCDGVERSVTSMLRVANPTSSSPPPTHCASSSEPPTHPVNGSNSGEERS